MGPKTLCFTVNMDRGWKIVHGSTSPSSPAQRRMYVASCQSGTSGGCLPGISWYNTDVGEVPATSRSFCLLLCDAYGSKSDRKTHSPTS